jgi:hypothetical protein
MGFKWFLFMKVYFKQPKQSGNMKFMFERTKERRDHRPGNRHDAF